MSVSGIRAGRGLPPPPLRLTDVVASVAVGLGDGAPTNNRVQGSTVAGFFYTGQSPSDIVEQARPLAEIGFDHVIFNVYDDYQGSPITRLGAEVLPALADL